MPWFFGDASNPVLPASPAYFSYVLDGDLTRAAQIAIAQGNSREQASPRHAADVPIPTPQGVWALETFSYDGQARLASKTLAYPSQDLPSLDPNYQYDTLNRMTEVKYPAQYGTATAERKKVDYTYELGDLDDLKIDGVEQASQLVYNAAVT